MSKRGLHETTLCHDNSRQFFVNGFSDIQYDKNMFLTLQLHQTNAHLSLIVYLYHASSTELFLCKDHVTFPSRLCEIHRNTYERLGID